MSSSNIITAVQAICTSKAAWRKHLSATYDDPRIVAAFELLRMLANDRTAIPADILAECEEFTAGEISRAAVEVCQRVGFKFFPASTADLLEMVLDQADKRRGELDAIFGDGGAR
jgi:hypothetical protein